MMMFWKKLLQRGAVNLLALSGLPYVLACVDGQKARIVTKHKEISETDKALVIAIMSRVAGYMKNNGCDKKEAKNILLKMADTAVEREYKVDITKEFKVL